MLQGFTDSGFHVTSLRQTNQRAHSGINRDLSFVAMFLHRENYFGIECFAKNLADLAQSGFNLFAIGGSNFVVPASVFDSHCDLQGEALQEPAFSC
jgi:hypothetical protein